MNDSEEYFQTEAVKKINEATELLLDVGLKNFTDSQLKEVSDRISLLQKQKLFWLEQDNYERYFYDLSKFAEWLLERVVLIESKFQGEVFKNKMQELLPKFFKKGS